jgi:multisubunit Na+/H+ antiporter MnhC subunit
MSDTLFITRALVVASVALVMCGAFAAWASANAIKGVAALVVAMAGALCAAAALGAPSALLIAGAALGFAQLAVGVSVTVRLQESYGAIERPEIDAEDARDDAGQAP